MTEGSKDRFVNTNGGGGGGGNVVITGPLPVPVDDATAQALITALTAVITGGLTITSMPEVEVKNDAGNPVPISVADGVDVAEGATTDAAVITDAAGTISGKLRGLVKWAYERMPTSLGQKLMAASFPVVLASDQSAVPVSGTVSVTQPVQVVGPAADGAAVSGNPVRIAGKDAGGLTQDALADTSGNLGAFLKSSTVAMGDGASNSPVQPINEASTAPVASAVYPRVYNGSTWDRQRGTAADGTLVNLGANNDVTVTSGNITADTELPAAAALADNTANPTVPAVGAFGMVWGLNNWDRLRGTATVGATTSPAVDSAAMADSQPNTIGIPVGGYDFNNAVFAEDMRYVTRAEVFNGSSWDRQRGTAADGTLVNLGSNNDVSINAGTNYIGRTDGYNGVIKDNSGDDCTVAHAGDLLDAAETVQIVAASGSKKIRVLDYELSQVAAAAGTFTWMSSGVQVAGTTRHLFDTGFSQPFRHAVAAERAFLFETAAGANLQINSNAASMRLDVRISYIYVD